MVAAAALLFGGVLAYRAVQPPTLTGPGNAETVAAPATVQTEMEKLQARLKANPDDTNAYAQLGLLMLQRVRENADPALYGQAEEAFQAALKRDPQQLDALVGMGSLALSRHAFVEAIAWGEKAQAINPFRAQIYGIIGDAQVELGRYPDAVNTIQKMVDTRPDVSSYTRVSYLRELHGDIPGAIDAMQRAAHAGAPGAEATLWSQTYLGHLHFNAGDLKAAEAIYQAALTQQPAYPYAIAGIARVRAAQGRTGEAITLYQSLVERLPLPEFAIALGELYDAAGKPEQAQAQFDLVRAIQQLNAGADMNTDMEMALFEADHGDAAKALTLARAAYERRPSIHGADALAWALHANGQHEEAWRYAQQALKLGTKDALLHFHAGMIALKVDAAAARQHLQAALDINPHFSVRFAPIAKAELSRLGAQ
jgi:tetratricopeptide (TPR) repeat protein